MKFFQSPLDFIAEDHWKTDFENCISFVQAVFRIALRSSEALHPARSTQCFDLRQQVSKNGPRHDIETNADFRCLKSFYATSSSASSSASSSTAAASFPISTLPLDFFPFLAIGTPSPSSSLPFPFTSISPLTPSLSSSLLPLVFDFPAGAFLFRVVVALAGVAGPPFEVSAALLSPFVVVVISSPYRFAIALTRPPVLLTTAPLAAARVATLICVCEMGDGRWM
jgi:hypothetical protein